MTARGRTASPRLVGQADPEDTLALVIIESVMDAVDLRADGNGSLIVMTKRVPAE
jgi:hypothetical protein